MQHCLQSKFYWAILCVVRTVGKLQHREGSVVSVTIIKYRIYRTQTGIDVSWYWRVELFFRGIKLCVGERFGNVSSSWRVKQHSRTACPWKWRHHASSKRRNYSPNDPDWSLPQHLCDNLCRISVTQPNVVTPKSKVTVWNCWECRRSLLNYLS